MILRSIVEGGQTTAHKVRMLRQVLRITFLCGVASATLFIGQRLLSLPPALYSGSFFAGKIWVTDKCGLSDVTIPGWVLNQVDETRTWSSTRVYSIEKARPFLKKYRLFWRNFFLKEGSSAVTVSGATSLAVLTMFGFYGLVRRRTKHLQGRRVSSRWNLAIPLTKIRNSFLHQPSKVTIGGIPMVPNSETQHIMISGGTGSGKTNCLREILKQLNNQKVIVVDPTQCLVDQYYNPDRGDRILNPFDERGSGWNPWEECQTDQEMSCFGEALIPISQNSEAEFWRSGARTIAVELLKHFRSSEKVSDVCRSLMHMKGSELFEMLSETPAGRFVDPSGDRTSASMLMEATRWIKSLGHLKDDKKNFTIRRWMRDSGNSWLFLSCTPTQRPQIRDLLRAWLNLAMRSLMDMEPDLARRVWFAIDELPSLERIQGLETLLSEGRKYGACTALCFQSPSQLDEMYGRSMKQVIVANCATRVAFREGDCANAKELSQCLGEREIEEHQEGISYGAHEMRDGVNISTRKTMRPCISPDDLMRLSPNQGYLSLPNNRPITKIRVYP